MNNMRNKYIYTDNITCPYCGDEIESSWEYDDDEGEIECEYCEKKFHYERHTTIKYTTSSNCEENNEEHDWGEWEYVSIDTTWRDEIPEEISDFYMRKCKKCDENDFIELSKLQNDVEE